MFWGGERLKAHLGALITDYDPKRIDRAAYRLSVGPEIYVSPTGEALRIWVALGPQCLSALFSNMAACSTVSSRWYLAFHSA